MARTALGLRRRGYAHYLPASPLHGRTVVVGLYLAHDRVGAAGAARLAGIDPDGARTLLPTPSARPRAVLAPDAHPRLAQSPGGHKPMRHRPAAPVRTGLGRHLLAATLALGQNPPDGDPGTWMKVGASQAPYLPERSSQRVFM